MDKTNVNYTLPVIAKKFKEYIEKNSLDFRDDRVRQYSLSNNGLAEEPQIFLMPLKLASCVVPKKSDTGSAPATS